MKQEILFSHESSKAIDALVEQISHDKVFVLTDTTTHQLCLPLLKDSKALANAVSIVIGASDTHKNLQTLQNVWTALQDGGASRRSLLICLGGGMVTDLGGFAASTFKRGIPFINVPTTLLSMVDAAVGGKTGINFGGLKNEIGVFSKSQAVLIDTNFLRSLDSYNICSGYAEMLKHGLISSETEWAELLTFDLDNIDYVKLQQLVEKNIRVKERIVEEDPTEKGIRKALNLGHTAGHAIESLALSENRAVLHGYAVAWGLVCELYLSAAKTNFPQDKMRQTIDFIKKHYGTFSIDCKQYDTLYNYMCHDKKNIGGIINFTLLSEIGQICLDQTATKDEINEMLDFFREIV